MIFEFLIYYQRSDGADIVSEIRDCLAKVLVDNLNDYDIETIERMLVIRTEREGGEISDANGHPQRRIFLGFALDLPEETASARVVVDEFAEALRETFPILHVVKFEDPLLRIDLARWTEEIYTLEMKLRRVLTLIYLNAYQTGDPYDLLREESVQPMSKDRLKAEQMRERAENQFFHLTFSQYVGLNQRPEVKLPALLELVRSKEAYEGFRAELVRNPVADEDDTVLLAGLKERMDAIESMRNCCAHSRRPSKKVEENYIQARPALDHLLDAYLGRWEYRAAIEEMIWDREAREAVERVMESAEWDDGTRSITIFDDHDERNYTKATNREELEDRLRCIAESAFYAYAPREDGEFTNHCDDYGIVEGVLVDYEQRLDDFWGEES